MLYAIVIGSGFSGIGMGVALRRRGITDFLIAEKADDVGGVWRDNDYPDAACDIPSHLYSFSFEPNPDWTRVFAPREEIHAYLRGCIEKYDLRQNMRFRTEVVSATFDEGASLWKVTLSDGTVISARNLIAATGQLSRPFVPALPGIEKFGGASFHSARWDRGDVLEGKKVAVIGTGASAIQLIPAIADKVKELTVFQRSAAYVLPRRDRSFSAIERWLFRKIPLVAKLYRLLIFLQHEARAFAFIRFAGLIEFFARRSFDRRLQRQVSDPETRRRLQPDYAIGCKRILLSNRYFLAFNKRHVRLVADHISRITDNGVETEDGRLHHADVIVYATGFAATSFLAPIRVTGRNGVELADAWKERVGAYLGISVPGFPNFFILYGPNTNLGHNSVVYMLESQIAHVMRCLELKDSAKADSIEIGEQPYRRFLARVRKRMKYTVWQNCRSWYFDESGQNTINWPNFSIYYSWLARRKTLSVYRMTKPRPNPVGIE